MSGWPPDATAAPTHWTESGVDPSLAAGPWHRWRRARLPADHPRRCWCWPAARRPLLRRPEDRHDLSRRAGPPELWWLRADGCVPSSPSRSQAEESPASIWSQTPSGSATSTWRSSTSENPDGVPVPSPDLSAPPAVDRLQHFPEGRSDRVGMTGGASGPRTVTSRDDDLYLSARNAGAPCERRRAGRRRRPMRRRRSPRRVTAWPGRCQD